MTAHHRKLRSVIAGGFISLISWELEKKKEYEEKSDGARRSRQRPADKQGSLRVPHPWW